jgi:hypothetical protein
MIQQIATLRQPQGRDTDVMASRERVPPIIVYGAGTVAI